MRTFAAALLLSFALAGPAAHAAVRAAEGQRLKVSGTWDGALLRASRVQERDAGKDGSHGQVEGVIADADVEQRSARIGPLTVTWDDETSFDGLTASELRTGVVVEVSGELVAPMRLHASTLEAGSDDIDADVVEIIGAVDDVAGADGGPGVAILGVPVELPAAAGALSALTLRGDDRRPEDQLTVDLFGKPLIVGGEIGVVSRYRDNFELDGTERVVRGDLEGQLELFYPFASHAAAFVEIKALNESELYQADGERETERAIERGEMWLYWNGFWDDRLAIQVGRQNFEDEREWWWDADLDAVRVYVSSAPWSFEVAAASELGRVSTLNDLEPAEQDVSRLLGHATWRWHARHRAELFLLRQDDRSDSMTFGATMPEDAVDESDADLTWLGLRAMGKTESGDAGRVQYWIDAALVRGSEQLTDFDTDDDDVATIGEIEERDVRGWAVDVGASWTLPLEWEPTVTLGYAVGSGDDGEGTDDSFRQTGLDNNNTKFRGVDRFRVYGELLQPELSNLGIFTASLGMELGEDRSVELVFHRYRQQEPSDELRDVRIDADLTGESADVGDEIDLVFGLEHWKHLELELIGSAFRAGEAYGELEGEWAFGFIGKVNINF